ncbi:MAG: exonuclease domain-containing protein [Mycobacteriaceae bacterium]|uniref:exonuclease domain-containing protein n=1 Tax=Corynebacterium sp. TaxID=1720 RepID=UPI003F9EA563
MSWGRRRRFDRAVSRAAGNATGPLADFYAVPFPGDRTRLADLPLLAVDVETTGLDPSNERLLSIGWVPVDGKVIDLAGATEIVLGEPAGEDTDDDGVGESATVHGLTDDDVAGGAAPADALGRLLEAMAGRAMLVHFEPMETGFLSAACQHLFGAKLEVPVVDTLALERRRMERRSTMPRGEDLRLPRVRERYGLPVYHSHRAVTDALACAELYLAITAPESVPDREHAPQSRYSTLGSLQD